MSDSQAAMPSDKVVARSPSAAQPRRQWFALRRPISTWQSILCGLACIAACFGIWTWLTAGEKIAERIVAPGILPSPQETFGQLKQLWFKDEYRLSINTVVSLRRVVLGFALATAVGIPIGVLCGCFTPVGAFFAPLMIFGRNIPIAALIPLTFAFFGIGEQQKVMFIFIACVAFIVSDTSRAVNDVSERYVDTSYTLGASRPQIIFKVLFPLALPSIFNSLRLLFGLAFGYIMLAELIKIGDAAGGLGYLIDLSQRRQLQTNIILVLLIIPLVALAIDRVLFWIQRELFPHQYGGAGLLRRLARWTLQRWEDVCSLVIRPVPYAEAVKHAEESRPRHAREAAKP